MSDVKQEVVQGVQQVAGQAIASAAPVVEKSTEDFVTKELKSLKDRFESFVAHLENKYGVREPHKDIR